MSLDVVGVEKHFPTRDGTLAALGPIDVTVADGEFLCLVGPSGCGKTTLLYLMAALEFPPAARSSPTVVMGSVLAITQATEDGVRNTSPVYLRAARNLGARGWQMYLFVILPSALPSIITGMKLGWSFAWRSLLAGELLYTLPGLGYLLMMGRELNDMGRVVAVMLVIITLGLLTDKILFGQLEQRVRERWGLQT
jgi:ABC-type nitrate/sulfonate/bicarbonate transport system permease component